MTPLQGKSILITRDASQAGSLKTKLERNGARVICVPTIKLIDPPDWEAFDKAATNSSQYDWVVFSSVNAVRKTAERLRKLGISTNILHSVKIAVVGDQTGKQVESEGWSVDLIPDTFQAEGVSRKLLGLGVTAKRFWIPRALKARNVLQEELEKSGAIVTITPVYQNRVPLENRMILRETLTRERLDWITFTSSSTVINFFNILEETPSQSRLPKLASIGLLTTETIKKVSLSPEFTADPQNLDGLCQGIIDWENARAEGK